jgi:hypothetical protein
MNNNRDLDFAVFQATVFEDTPDDLGLLYHPQTPGDDLLRFLSLRLANDRAQSGDAALCKRSEASTSHFLACRISKYTFGRSVSERNTFSFAASITLSAATKGSLGPAFVNLETPPTSKRPNVWGTVKNAGLLTWSRRRALLGLTFGFAESWLRVARADCCNSYDAPGAMPALFLDWSTSGRVGLGLGKSQSL